MTPKKLTPKQLEKELRVLKEDIQMSQTGLENCKSEEDRESYIRLEKGYQKQLDDLIKNNPPKIKKVKVVYWTPESKGEIDKSIFEGQPFLTVNVKDSYTERPTYDSIRGTWYRVSTERCVKLVEEMGYIVGVIKRVIVGVVQVEDWKRHEIREGENQGRVEFMGELLTDHPSIDYTLKDITVSGVLQGFNFPDQDEKES